LAQASTARCGASLLQQKGEETMAEEAFPVGVDTLLATLNVLNTGVYVTDAERRIVVWNRKAEEVTGHHAADVVGRACHDDVLCHEDKDGHRLCVSDLCPLYRAILLNKESDRPVLVYARRADGRRVPVSVSVAPLRDASGSVVGGIETFRDETAQLQDLEFAKKIQRDALPDELPEDDNVGFDARYYPCELIGGDFYDIRRLAEGWYGVLVADVAGHGVSAALYTMWLRSLSERLSELAGTPGEFLSALNRELARYTVTESFATAVYAVVDAGTREVTYCNAGHPPPLHWRSANGEVVKLQSGGLPLGIVEDAEYAAEAMHLEPGDFLLCYTDGLIEVAKQDGGMLGTEGLSQLLSEVAAGASDKVAERLYRRVKRLNADISLADDVLVLAIHSVWHQGHDETGTGFDPTAHSRSPQSP
jgi:PAS domain S-box-containing protein